MIAKSRRMAIQDFLLVASSVVVIVLSLWPHGDVRQTLEFRDPAGLLQRYSLEVDDPRLAKLRRELAMWSRSRPETSRALEKWRAEIADFYAKSTEPKTMEPDQIARVSFSDEQPSATAVAEANQRHAQHLYWIQMRDEAREAVTRAESALKQQPMLIGPPPIVLADVTRGGPPPRIYVLASIIGLCVASGFAWWVFICPAIRLQSNVSPLLQSPQPDDTGRFAELRLAIPATWVRVHQPAPVVVRRIVYTAVVVGGVVSVIL